MKRYNLVNNLLGWACFLVAAVTYLLTIEPTASFWDCPEFISQGAKLEVGHPPGNPIFMLTARFFVTIFGNSMANAAVAINVMSALLSAATILLLFWSITHLVRRIVMSDDQTEPTLYQMLVIMGAGVCGALAYTWSDTFWFSAVEAEVYAFSSFCTALVFWLICKWENRADQPHSDRYLLLIAYVIGISIAVHLLNLLCIPAIALVIYYRKWGKATAKGSIITLCLSFVVVAAILYGLVPGFVKVAQWFELLFVNGLGLGYNMGVLIYAIVLVGVFCMTIRALYRQRSAMSIKLWFFFSIVLSGLPFIGSSGIVATVIILGIAVYLLMFCPKVPVRIFNLIVMSIFVIFIGYSSYALLLIRASANTPMNQNAPDNVFALASYLSREQYGDRPLFKGVAFAEQLDTQEYPRNSGNYIVLVDKAGYPETRVVDGYLRSDDGSVFNEPTTTYTKVVKTSPDEPDRYVEAVSTPHYRTSPDLDMLFTRIYSTKDHDVEAYKSWAYYTTPDIADIPVELRHRWAEQGYAPLYELAPYLTHQETVATAIDANGNPTSTVSAWKPGFGTNLRYFINYQLNHMYWRYFMWNFAGRQNDLQGNGEPNLGNWISGIPVIDNARLGDQTYLPDEYGKGNKGHNVYYMLPLLLGLIGLLWQSLYRHRLNPHRGIEQFWVVFFLFFMTGIAIVLYLNQTPGQPRERDYAFAGSFYAFAIWIGMGVPAIASLLCDLFRKKAKPAKEGEKAPEADSDEISRPKALACAGVACLVGLVVPLQMVSQTWDDHDRSGRYTARDFGMNYLSSVDPEAIIITYGDNDTFPLWYAQEVEGYRTDVRVVNSSYLTTDWYANQMRHPFYDGKAIPMYATPADYGYERMGWSFLIPMNDSVVDAETALRELYSSDVRRFDAPYLTSTNIRMPIDRAAAIERYDLAGRVDSAVVAPYLGDIKFELGRYGSGMSLYRTLLLDILSNSVKDKWQRPVYIASTVPSSQYQGFAPYLANSGMAYEIVPFGGAPISVNAEKAYENILGKFRWGGLDQPGATDLYLDETVRRMVASTRSAIYKTANDLMMTGDLPASKWAVDYATEHGEPVPATRYDMARRLLDLLEEKMSGDVAPYDNMLGVDMAGDYLTLYGIDGDMADIDKAEALLDRELDRYAQLVKYATSLDTPTYNSLNIADIYAVRYLNVVLALKNRLALVRALAGKPENELILKAVTDYPGSQSEISMAPLIYLQDYDLEHLLAQRSNFSGAQLTVLNEAIVLLQAHVDADIDPHKLTDEVVDRYGINLDRWLRLQNY